MIAIFYLILQILKLYSYVVIANVLISWLISFNIINTSNRFIFSMMNALFRLCEPSLRLIRQYLPNLGAIDISPVIVYLLLWFIKSLLIEYWPR